MTAGGVMEKSEKEQRETYPSAVKSATNLLGVCLLVACLSPVHGFQRDFYIPTCDGRDLEPAAHES